MAGVSARLHFGNPKGVADVAAQIRSQIIRQVAQATIERVQDRTDHHPAAETLKPVPINQWSCEISGSRGGPGPITPVNATVLAFTVAGSTVFARSVRGVGLGPLIAAEAGRVTLSNLDPAGVIVK